MSRPWSTDRFYRKAKREGYRSRAVYKLEEIQRRFHVIRPDDSVVDLGAAPGSWLQELRTMTQGKVVGVDRNPIAPVEGVVTIAGDFTDPKVQQRVASEIGVANVVVSDAAPKLSGNESYDQARAIDLGLAALRFARSTLKRGGNFVVKSFQGALFDELHSEVKKHFLSVRIFRPAASRKGSAEVYIVAKNFRGREDAEA
ncbi:MAG: RlmE family RNA methyltransferase [Methanomicrobiales archaeon]|nr:RlmE family RNA methyltransferase [Methanomicrobiales archaeon]MDI6876409.1 RlmE family RNA methyltransferase [Methanomicrobiales archaeon]